MGGTISKESYIETGLEVLSDLGYGGLKLAEVCNRLGVTTGSFYHYFSSWSAFGQELVAYWAHARTVRVGDKLRAESDPRRRMDVLIQEALLLPFEAKAAIRVWSSIDQTVHEVQVEVDRQRYAMLLDAGVEILGDQRQAERFATTALYLLVGCEQATLPRDPDHLTWIADRLLFALDNGVFANVPGGR